MGTITVTATFVKICQLVFVTSKLDSNINTMFIIFDICEHAFPVLIMIILSEERLYILVNC